MKLKNQPTFYVATCLIAIAIVVVAFFAGNLLKEDNQKELKALQKENQSLTKEIKAQEDKYSSQKDQLKRCIKVMNSSLLANAYFLLTVSSADSAVYYYNLADQEMDKYSAKDTDYCRGDS